jgi:peptidoglycan/LPS O-acetylase OafA/YrhL
LIPAALAMVAAGPLYRLSYVLSGYLNMTALATYISTLSSLDTLGMGALLAMAVHAHPANPVLKQRLQRWVLPPAVVAAAAILKIGGDIDLVLLDPVGALVFCGCIYGAVDGYGGLLGRLLEWNPLRYLGKVSYGLYVYHPLMRDLSVFLFGLAGISPAGNFWQINLLGMALTFVVAALSWHLMEKPLNDLKRYF